MSRILVTGGTGFIGRVVADELRGHGHEVIAAGRADGNLLVPSEARRLIDRSAADVLVHLAWHTEHGAFWTAPENLDWVAASCGLLRDFARAGGRRIVAAGTCVEPGPSLYGTAKDGLRRIAERWAGAEGLALAWARIHFLFGPGEDARRLVPSVVRGLARGERVATTAGDRVRDFMYVDDAGSAIAAVALAETTGVVDVGTGRGLAVRDLVGRIAAEMGAPELLDVGALPSRDDEPVELVADPAVLRSTGHEETVGTDEGLRRTIEWWSTRG